MAAFGRDFEEAVRDMAAPTNPFFFSPLGLGPPLNKKQWKGGERNLQKKKIKKERNTVSYCMTHPLTWTPKPKREMMGKITAV